MYIILHHAISSARLSVYNIYMILDMFNNRLIERSKKMYQCISAEMS